MNAGTIIVLLLTCCTLMCDCSAIRGAKKPCSASRLHVRAPNQEVGSWDMQLGQLEGRVEHKDRDNAEAGDVAGDWEAALYNRDEGCTDNDVQLFEGRANGGVTGTDESPAVIPEGYESVTDGGLHKLHPLVVSWEHAEATCESEGAHLAVANSKIEAAALVEMLRTGANPNDTAFHVGVYWSNEEDDFYTVLGYPLGQAGYEIWARGEPNIDQNDPPCVELSTSMQLSTESCSELRPFICEIVTNV